MEIGLLHFRRFSATKLRAFGIIAAVWSATSCHTIDTTREAPPKATLGDDMYGVFCDRVGASSITEDTSGASFHAVCHYDDKGQYADKIDESVLPPPASPKAQEARRLAVAKLDAMARHRGELIRALNTAFPDVTIDDVTKPGQKIRLHDALLDFSQSITPLYDSNPFEKQGEPLLPSSTRSMARLFDALLQSDTARDVLSHVWGRRGYRPSQVGLGAVRPALGYPGLRAFTGASLGVLAPNGAAIPELNQLFTVGKQELLTAKPTTSKLAPLVIDPNTHQPNRPRSTMEVASAIFLAQDKAFAQSDSDPVRPIALRDRRGFAVTSLGAPFFVDADGDGLPDVDAFGRFVDANGKPVSVGLPFEIPGEAKGDTAGLYKYIDTSRTAIGAVTRHLVPLVDATSIGKGPDAWKDEHETLMYALGGAYVLYGGREPAQYDYKTDTIKGAGEACPDCLKYTRFKSEESPLPDLIHAAGQVLADPESDAIIESLLDLTDNHADTVARLLGAALKVREISLAHDALAAQNKEPFATMPYETPVWDEMAALINDITKKPGLLAQLLVGLAKDDVVTPQGSSQHLGETVAAFLENRDEYQYNPSDINGPTINLTAGAPSTADPKFPVDQTKPKTGKNRSILQRTLQIIHDANGGPQCNKDGAKVSVNVSGAKLTWPVGSSYKACELFRFENLATFYLDSILPIGNPKRSQLVLQNKTLQDLMDFLNNFVSADKVFSSSSGITSLTTHPGPEGLNRLVFFGASSDFYANMPDLDPFIGSGQTNEQTNKFISNVIEPISAAWCPVDPNDPNKIPHCTDQSGTLRGGDPATLFAAEHLGFYPYLQPLVVAFANAPCDVANGESPQCGEELLVRAIDIFNRHWPGKEHGPECEKSGNPKKYCSEAGLNTYEPIAAEAFRSDLIPALHDFAYVATKVSSVTVKRGPDAGKTLSGAEVVEKLTRILFSQDYAASMKMVDRKGNPATKWVDGTPQPQLTVFTLFADALHKIDTRFATACSDKTGSELDACKADVELRQGQWKRARSQLVDEFLGVEGTDINAKFKDRALPKILGAGLRVIREQLNAQCPDREKGTPCTWAQKDFGDKLASTLSGPLFAALMDVQEKLRLDEGARRETERLLTYILSGSAGGDAAQATLASLSDILQVLVDDGHIAPILNTIAGASSPEGDKDGPGAADTGLKVLRAVTSDTFDRYHVLDQILPNLVTPIDGGAGLSPIEIIMDTIADVNRVDAEKGSNDPLTTDDYKAIMSTMKGFMSDNTRGLEQFYTIVKNRPRE